MERQETEVEISITMFWQIFRKRWIPILALAVLVSAAVGILYGTVLYKPVYSSRSQYYLSNVDSNEEDGTNPSYSSGQTAGAEAMAKYCASYMDGSEVLTSVLEDAKLSDRLTLEKLRKMITTKVDSGSAVFTVEVTGRDPALNYRISRSVERVLPAYVDYFNCQTTEPMVGESSMMVKVIDRSVQSDQPENRSNLVKYPVLVFVLVFVLTYLVFLIIALTDRTVYGRRDLQEKFPKASVFGVIPHWEIGSGEEGQKKGKKKPKHISRKVRFRRANVEDRLITAPKTPYRVTDAFEQLCTNLTFCSDGDKGCTVGVLSSVLNSGKSFVMANLAISLSRLIGKKILLVDADMRCPMQHQIFRFENQSGLSNLLAGQADIKSFVPYSYGGDSLHIITSGTIPPNPMELLSGPKMAELMEYWKREYDYVLVDLPPVGDIPDAVAVSKLISGFLYVLRSGLSDAVSLKETVHQLEEKNVNIFGYVLTDVEDRYDFHYGYGKYSKYSKYYSYYHHGDSGNKPAEQ